MLLRLPSPHDSVSQNARAHEQQGPSWQDYAYRRSTGLGHLLRLSFLRLSLSLLHLLLLGVRWIRNGLHRLFHHLFLWRFRRLFQRGLPFHLLLCVLRHGGGRQDERDHESEGYRQQQSSHVSSLRSLTFTGPILKNVQVRGQFHTEPRE